jgi:hypothetical protein
MRKNEIINSDTTRCGPPLPGGGAGVGEVLSTSHSLSKGRKRDDRTKRGGPMVITFFGSLARKFHFHFSKRPLYKKEKKRKKMKRTKKKKKRQRKV